MTVTSIKTWNIERCHRADSDKVEPSVKVELIKKEKELAYKVSNKFGEILNSGEVTIAKGKTVDEQAQTLSNREVVLDDDLRPSFSSFVIEKEHADFYMKIILAPCALVCLITRKDDNMSFRYQLPDEIKIKTKHHISRPRKFVDENDMFSTLFPGTPTSVSFSDYGEKCRALVNCSLHDVDEKRRWPNFPIPHSVNFVPNVLVSKVDNSTRISAFRWAITLVTNRGSNKNTKHAEIIIEGISDGSSALSGIKTNEYSVKDPNKKWEAEIGNRFAILADFLGPAVRYNLLKEKKEIKWSRRSVVWQRPAQEVEKMLSIIRSQSLIMENNTLPFNILGASSIFSGKRDSCITWSLEKLEIAGIIIRKHFPLCAIATSPNYFVHIKNDKPIETKKETK